MFSFHDLHSSGFNESDFRFISDIIILINSHPPSEIRLCKEAYWGRLRELTWEALARGQISFGLFIRPFQGRYTRGTLKTTVYKTYYTVNFVT